MPVIFFFCQNIMHTPVATHHYLLRVKYIFLSYYYFTNGKLTCWDTFLDKNKHNFLNLFEIIFFFFAVTLLLSFRQLFKEVHLIKLVCIWAEGTIYKCPTVTWSSGSTSRCINNCFSQTQCLFTFCGDGLGSQCPWSTPLLYLIPKTKLPGQLLSVILVTCHQI